MKKVPLRRTVALVNHRKPAFPLALRAEILRRDMECVAAKLGFVHECRSTYGLPHAPYALDLLTMEHVKDELMAGRKAPDDARHVVALCGVLNVRPPSREMRAAFRAYLEQVSV